MQGKSVCSLGSFTQVFIYIFLLYCSAIELSAAAEDLGEYYSQRLNGPKVSAYEGEQIDTFTGKLTQEIVDVVVPGNGGMDIRIGRSFAIRPDLSKAPSSIGNWSIEIPYIWGNLWPGSTNTEIFCKNPHPGYNARWMWQGLMLKLPGSSTAQMIPVDGAPVTGILNGVTKVASPISEYKTLDFIKVECIKTDKGSHNGFLVTTTEGIKYTFDRSFHSNIHHHALSPSWNQRSLVNYYPSKVEDVHGNTLSYEYVSDDVGYLHIKRISSSDGREVLFNYETVSIDWGGLGHGHTVTQHFILDYISANGQIWDYQYEDKRYEKDIRYPFPQYTGIRLKQVVRPDGSKWQYEYGAQTKLPVGLVTGCSVYYRSSKQCLANTITPTGARIEYTYVRDSDYIGHDNAVKTRTVILGNNQSVLNIEAIKTDEIYGDSLLDSDTLTITHTMGNIENIYAFDRRWWDKKLGVLKRHTIKDKALGVELQVTDYEWVVGEKIGDTNINQSVQGPLYPKFLSVETVGRDGSSYTKRYSDYNQYGNPGKIEEDRVSIETNGIDSIRQNIEYDIALQEKNILHKLTKIDTIEVRNGVENTAGAIAIVYNPKTADLIKEIKNGITTGYTYHPSGDLRTVTDARGVVTKELNDYYRGIPREEFDGERNRVTRIVNDTGSIHSETNPRGNTTVFDYDGLNRLRLVDNPKGNDLVIDWPNPNEKIETRGLYSKKTSYDGLGREISSYQTTDSTWIRVDKEYDQFGRIIFESYPYNDDNNSISHDANGRAIDLGTRQAYGKIRTYDALHRERTMTDGAGSTVTYNYLNSTDGLVIEVIDPKRHKTKQYHRCYSSPDDCELIKVESPEQTQQNIERDILGNILSISEVGPKNTVLKSRNYNYDASKGYFLDHVVNPETGLTDYVTDEVGNITQKKVGNAPWITYSYDALNRVTHTDFPDNTPDVAIEFDANGNINWVDNSLSRWDYAYDENDNLTSETLKIDGHRIQFRYTYTENDHLDIITYPSGKVIDLLTDDIGQRHGPAPYVTGVKYYANGVPKSITYNNSKEMNYDLDNRGQIERIYTSDFTSLYQTYTFDDSGNISGIGSKFFPSESISFSYDGLNRLTTATSDLFGDGSISYVPYSVGNIESKNLGDALTFNYDTNGTNLLNSISGSTNYQFTYDDYGNVSGNGKNLFVYNHASQLTEVMGEGAVQNTYDGNNRLIKEVNNLGTTYRVHTRDGKLRFQFDPKGDWYQEFYYLGNQKIASRKVTEVSKLDSDGDGMDDNFEIRFGFSPLDSTDAAGDQDGDGLTNLEEYQLGSNPIMVDSDTGG